MIFVACFLVVCCVAASAEEVPTLPVDFTPGMPVQEANYVSNWEYEDPTIHVEVVEDRKYNCDYWYARIKIGHASQLRTAAAGGFENEVTMQGVMMARRQNAVLAIDGDYYCYKPFGEIRRQGILYRSGLTGERDVLAIDEAGDFHIFQTPTGETVGESINGKKIINVFYFGPGIVVDGQLGNLSASAWAAPSDKRQRMCIAQVGPLEYFALCCDGPARGSYGMDLKQFASLAIELGAVNAYNLDGGDSTLMVFRGEKINDPENKSHRAISDIIYFASAWDGR